MRDAEAENIRLRAALDAVRKLCVDEAASVWHVSEPFASSILAVLDAAAHELRRPPGAHLSWCASIQSWHADELAPCNCQAVGPTND